ncbi:MAG: adenylate/guanylate cyclase domain-containing protein [Verrucomicrobia bacterium]|nr:adenylate/guanylate cyclase domain-containing protein [Verrucomicrobiota bacterium]
MPPSSTLPGSEPSASSSGFEQALAAEERLHEAQAEEATCKIMGVVIVACYLLALIFRPSHEPQMFRIFTLLTGVSVGVLALIYWVVRRGGYFPLLTYLNVSLQISLISAVFVVDAQLIGPVFAMSSLGPVLYPLIIALTALRTRPWLCVFAGMMSSLQFLLIYTSLRLGPGGELLAQSMSLGWGVTLMKIAVLIGVGVGAGLAAHRFARKTQRNVATALRMTAMQKVFGRYVSPSIAEAALQPNSLSSRRTKAVVLFGDLRNFTSFCASREAEEVVAMLNQYFEVACRVIEAEGGIVNKFIGDGFLAFFGVMSSPADAEASAVRAALRLNREVTPVLKSFGLRAGFAISSGLVVAGEIGSVERCEFSLIGEAVNRAARLEGLNSGLGSTCLITEEIAASLGPEIPIREQGARQIKGLAEPIRVFEVLVDATAANPTPTTPR